MRPWRKDRTFHIEVGSKLRRNSTDRIHGLESQEANQTCSKNVEINLSPDGFYG